MSDFERQLMSRITSPGDRELQNRLSRDEHAAFAKDRVLNASRDYGPVVGGLNALAYSTLGEPVWQTLKTWSKYNRDPEAEMRSVGEIPGYILSSLTPKPVANWIQEQVPVLQYNPELASDFNLTETMPATAKGALSGYYEYLQSLLPRSTR